jgi:plastocyanin
MKKLYALLFALIGFTAANATIHTVTVASNSFTPSSFTAMVGDTVRWVWSSGTHTTTSTSVPTGATTWNANMTSTSTTFQYVIPAAGTYNYECTIHSGMTGSFTASGVGIVKNGGTSALVLFPNPAKDKLTITHNTVDAIQVFDMVGSIVMKQSVEATETKTVVEIGTLPSGVYFVNTMKDGIITDTRRLVKVN